MMVHMQDGGELNILVDDSGGLVTVCSKCKKVWTGSLTPTEVKPAGAKATTSSRVLSMVSSASPMLLEQMGIDASTLADLK